MLRISLFVLFKEQFQLKDKNLWLISLLVIFSSVAFIKFFNAGTLIAIPVLFLYLGYFLSKKSDDWKQKYIKNIVNVNVPFGGVIVSLRELIQNTFYNRLIGRDVLSTLGGLLVNLPNKNIIKPILLIDGKENDNYF